MRLGAGGRPRAPPGSRRGRSACSCSKSRRKPPTRALIEQPLHWALGLDISPEAVGLQDSLAEAAQALASIDRYYDKVQFEIFWNVRPCPAILGTA